MSQDFSEVLNAQIADLKEEMGIIDPPKSSVEPVQEVVEEVKVEPAKAIRKETGKKVKLPSRVKKLKEEAKPKQITSYPIPRRTKQRIQSETVYGDCLNEMFGAEEKREISRRVEQRVIKENVEAKPFRPQLSHEELSKSMYEKYHNDVKGVENLSSTTMSPATVKALSDNLSFMSKDDVKKEDFIMDNNMVVFEKLKGLQMQMNMLNTNFSALKEGTMVSGIGQGGDGQLPGGGEVQLKYMDDVSIDNIQPGDTLVWDPSNGGSFVPGAGGGGGGGAVDRLVGGLGIDLNPPGGIGVVEIVLDASIKDLNDVADGMTPLNGDILVYNNSRWNIGKIDTAGVALTNGTRFRNAYPRLTPGSYSTQEDANQLFAAEIDDLIVRVNHIDGSVKPGLFLGLIDATVADNEPDDPANELNPGDYFIHDGGTGPLWGVGEEIDDKNSVVWTGAIWEVLTSSNTLAQLGDVTLQNPLNGHILVYNEGENYWENEEPQFPKVTVGTVQPNNGSEKDGDIYYDQNTSELYIYNTVWEKVSGGGGSVKISADAPENANEGDLWVETDNWTILVYDGFNWVGLTNSGLVAGEETGAYVTHEAFDGTVDSLNFVINQNKQTAESGLIAAVTALDDTHLRMTPQGPLTGVLKLSDDPITGGKQAVHKEHVDQNFLKLHPQAALTTSLKFQRGEEKTGPQYKISLNGGTDYSTSIYSMQGGQMRFRTSHSDKEGDHQGSHIILDPAGGIPQTKIYHVVEPTEDKMAANKEYVDGLFGNAGVPVGAIMIWMSTVAPPGWFRLNGGSFFIDEYPKLHQYLSGTHNYTAGLLPNWKGRYPGHTGDHLYSSLGSFMDQSTAKPSSGAPYSYDSFPDGSTRSFNGAGGTNAYSDGTTRVHVDGGWDSVTRPPTVVVQYIIKHD